MDFAFNSTKSVGIARELAGIDNAGDARTEQTHREAVGYAMGLIEQDMQTLVRVGGAAHDRVTGDLVECPTETVAGKERGTTCSTYQICWR